ncbi:hypothetical protein ODZ84_05420 [Chryseobacterium fluminis]|uniref:hypothetical protein n=1 Tax=Chryseobacterium fluminis TaxID=2983606 RepID=UPI002253AE99|nr:hypothetical protein [Chryseobacterium sp. MMS21-Ot14]UZT99013.1 hypothetical protein ODZ84_05420 [Chryseobacterium sp. MMS21-Ot14]
MKETNTSINPTMIEASPSNYGIWKVWLIPINTITTIRPATAAPSSKTTKDFKLTSMFFLIVFKELIVVSLCLPTVKLYSRIGGTLAKL